MVMGNGDGRQYLIVEFFCSSCIGRAMYALYAIHFVATNAGCCRRRRAISYSRDSRSSSALFNAVSTDDVFSGTIKRSK